MHGTEGMLEARMLSAGEDPPGRLQLVDATQPLQPWVIEQVLLRRDTVAVDAFRDLDIAEQWIGHQVHRLVLAREITHSRQHFSERVVSSRLGEAGGTRKGGVAWRRWRRP